jgi:hypothetical protein
MKERLGSLFVVLLAAMLASGMLLAGSKDPWIAKPFDQWTDQDIQTILTVSPWIQKVTVEATWKPMTPGEMPESAPGIPSGAQSQPTAGGGNGTSQNRPQTVIPAEADPNARTRGDDVQFLVYWMSSRTMRGAVARRAELHAGEDPKEAAAMVAQPQETYRIIVQGTDMAPFQRQEEKAYGSLAWLQLKKSKDKISPSHVDLQKDNKGVVTSAVFQFPKKNAAGGPTIPPDTKGVEFDCKVGASTLKAYFDPPKMTDSQGPDL